MKMKGRNDKKKMEEKLQVEVEEYYKMKMEEK